MYPPRRSGVAHAIVWVAVHVIVIASAAAYVMLRTWQHTHSRLQTTLAVVLFVAILRLARVKQQSMARKRIVRELPRFYDYDGSTAL